jgi:enamine deaminase RidA (YjgF/YER057c/UK114 family)
MNSIEKRLQELNISLPDPKGPVGAYVATKLTGKLLFISGQVSMDKDNKLITGKIGKDLNLEQGYAAAERCGLSLIAHVKKACGGDLEKVKSCIKLTGFVNSIDTFVDQPKVINGASDIIYKILDKKGEHTRAAVSVNSLPLGVAVEVDGIFELN